MFEGSFVALVTPFKDDESLDESKLKELLEFQIEGGTDGIVPCGTTGESPALSDEEHNRVVELAVQTVNGRLPVIAGTGSNSTTRTLHATEHAKAAGADGVLIVTPYYNKPTQNGLYAHYMKDCRQRRHPDYHLQRPRQMRHRHSVGNGCSTCRTPEHRRSQGSHRRPQTRQRSHFHVPRRFRRAFGR